MLKGGEFGPGVDFTVAGNGFFPQKKIEAPKKYFGSPKNILRRNPKI